MMEGASTERTFGDLEETRAASPPPPESANESSSEPSSSEDSPAVESASIESPRIELPSGGDVFYCRRCQEPLSFFITGPWHCWKCDLEFDPRRPSTYIARRTLLKWKFWWPGFCLAVSGGMLAFSLLAHTRSLGLMSITAGTVILGSLLGYGAPLRVRVYAMLTITLLCMLVSTIGMGTPAGLFVGFLGSLIVLAPVGAGMVAGVILRVSLQKSNWDQRWYFP